MPASSARIAFVAEEYRTIVSEDASVKGKHLLARDVTVDSLLDEAADATTEVARQQAFHKVRRVPFTVRVADGLFNDTDYPLGGTITLKHPRLGLAAGQDFIIVGKTEDEGDGAVVLKLLG